MLRFLHKPVHGGLTLFLSIHLFHKAGIQRATNVTVFRRASQKWRNCSPSDQDLLFLRDKLETLREVSAVGQNLLKSDPSDKGC